MANYFLPLQKLIIHLIMQPWIFSIPQHKWQHPWSDLTHQNYDDRMLYLIYHFIINIIHCFEIDPVDAKKISKEMQNSNQPERRQEDLILQSHVHINTNYFCYDLKYQYLRQPVSLLRWLNFHICFICCASCYFSQIKITTILSSCQHEYLIKLSKIVITRNNWLHTFILSPFISTCHRRTQVMKIWWIRKYIKSIQSPVGGNEAWSEIIHQLTLSFTWMTSSQTTFPSTVNYTRG